MEEQIIKFVAALRSQGVHVSLAESTDAFNAINHMGVQQREVFKLSLRSTLIKDRLDLAKFDELFPLFFSTGTQTPMLNAAEELSPKEAQMIAQSLQELSEHFQEILERLIQGEPLTEDELNKLSQQAGIQSIENLQYKEWVARRMERAMQFDTVRKAMINLMQALRDLGMNSDRGEQLNNLMNQNADNWRQQIRQQAGQQIAQQLANKPSKSGIDQLMNRPINSLSEKDMLLLRIEVRRLAATLRTRISLRQKRAKSGTLDPKATIRANLKHAGVPFNLKYRNKHQKPKLVVICDISTSMRYCSELMLSMIYTLQDLVTRTHAFAFIDHLEYISPDFYGRQTDEAIDNVLRRMPPGYYSTDLGYALMNFNNDYLDVIDNRTSLIIVGDGRNNYNNPQIELFKTLARRAHRTLWINPEPKIQWNTGDSDMRQYAPHCDEILQARTLNDLTQAVNTLML